MPFSRRDLMKRLGLLGAAALTGCSSSAPDSRTGEPADRARPNFLVMLGDDHGWIDIGCYGNRDLHTPNMDRLATEGLRFTRAFTATAMCAPTRQQLYTGLFPVRSGAFPNHSRVYDGTRSVVHYLQALGYRVGLAGKAHFGPPESFPFEVVGKGIDFDAIREFVDRDPAQPFCLFVCSSHPHAPWNAGDPDRFDPEALTLAPYLIDTPEQRIALAQYYAEIEALDAQLGQCLDILGATGQDENTLVAYTSEQGPQFPFAKWTCYDMGLRVALIARWPGRIEPGTVTDAMVQYVDITPTLVQAAGGEPPSDLDGRSFLEILHGRTDHHNDEVFGVHTTRGIIDGSPCWPVRSIRTETHKLILNLNHETVFTNIVTEQDRENYWRSWLRKAEADPAAARRARLYQHRPAVELYDIVNDPFELEDLAEDPAEASRIADLRRRLAAWMRRQGDEGNATEMDARNRQGKG